MLFAASMKIADLYIARDSSRDRSRSGDSGRMSRAPNDAQFCKTFLKPAAILSLGSRIEEWAKEN